MALSFLIVILLLTSFLVQWRRHAYHKADRHFIAMEGDEEIFKAILEPLIVETKGFKKQCLDSIDAVDDVEFEELPDSVIQLLNRYYK